MANFIVRFITVAKLNVCSRCYSNGPALGVWCGQLSLHIHDNVHETSKRFSTGIFLFQNTVQGTLITSSLQPSIPDPKLLISDPDPQIEKQEF